jgi:hypothetical protein
MTDFTLGDKPTTDWTVEESLDVTNGTFTDALTTGWTEKSSLCEWRRHQGHGYDDNFSAYLQLDALGEENTEGGIDSDTVTVKPGICYKAKFRIYLYPGAVFEPQGPNAWQMRDTSGAVVSTSLPTTPTGEWVETSATFTPDESTVYFRIRFQPDSATNQANPFCAIDKFEIERYCPFTAGTKPTTEFTAADKATTDFTKEAKPTTSWTKG